MNSAHRKLGPIASNQRNNPLVTFLGAKHKFTSEKSQKT